MDTTMIYSGSIFKLVQKTVRLPDGRDVKRDILLMSGAAAVVPVMEDGRILFVRQYRDGVNAETLEIPAGKMDGEEEPLTCAVRELEEETGFKADSMRFLFRLSPSTAYNTEMIYLYLAEGLRPGRTNPDDDEFVTVETYTLEEAIDMITDGRIIDGKTIAALLYYECMRRA